jgi:hypothetical protein
MISPRPRPDGPPRRCPSETRCGTESVPLRRGPSVRQPVSLPSPKPVWFRRSPRVRPPQRHSTRPARGARCAAPQPRTCRRLLPGQDAACPCRSPVVRETPQAPDTNRVRSARFTPPILGDSYATSHTLGSAHDGTVRTRHGMTPGMPSSLMRPPAPQRRAAPRTESSGWAPRGSWFALATRRSLSHCSKGTHPWMTLASIL